jgi:hypothetical protein
MTSKTFGKTVATAISESFRNGSPDVKSGKRDLLETVEMPSGYDPCPPNYNQSEWKRAQDNQRFYLKLAKSLNKPWFRCPRHNYQYSELVYVTPEMAQIALEHMVPNRREMISHSAGLSRDYKENNFQQTHESLAFNLDGMMHDGQHRCRGIVLANKSYPLYVTWNLPPESMFTVDSGEKRKVDDKLAILFPGQVTNNMSSLCRRVMRGLNTTRVVKYTAHEIAEFANKYSDEIAWVLNNRKRQKTDVQAVCLKGLLWYGEGVVGEFLGRLNSLNFKGSDNDPIKQLYRWQEKLSKELRRTYRVTANDHYRKALSALVSFANGEEHHRLKIVNEDLFAWVNPGWNVPEGAPSGGKIFIK